MFRAPVWVMDYRTRRHRPAVVLWPEPSAKSHYNNPDFDKIVLRRPGQTGRPESGYSLPASGQTCFHHYAVDPDFFDKGALL